MKRKRLSKSLFDPIGKRREGAGEWQGVPNNGYFREAIRRFLRMRLSAVALFVIGAIMLFALLAPIFIPSSGEDMDPYYAKMGPRNAHLARTIGIMHGSRHRRLGERGMVRLAAIGMGALDKSGEGGVSARLAIGGEYTPLLSYGREDGARVYDVNIDSYLEVGFVYILYSR